MPDMDAFELRFSAAYRRYLEELDTDVDALALARSVAAGGRRRGTRSVPLRWGTATAWTLVLSAVLGIAVFGALLTGMRLPVLFVEPTASPPASPSPSLSAGLLGTWSRGELATLAVHPCGLGEACGRFELISDSNESCVYTLEYRPRDGDDFVYFTAQANTMGCAWSGLFVTDLHVRLLSSGSVVASFEGLRSWELELTSAAFEPQLPPTVAGALSSPGGQELLTLDACGPGESCGTLTLLRGDVVCRYDLEYRPRTYEAFVFWIASGTQYSCDSTGWQGSLLVVRPVAIGEFVVTHAPGAIFQMYEIGYVPMASTGVAPVR